MKVISNATPLISLAVCGQLRLLPRLFTEVIVPTTVHHEVTHNLQRVGALEVAQVTWLQIVSPKTASPLSPLLLGLDAGEMSVLLLAQELKPDWVLIDERLARRVAQAMGFSVKGTLGILLAGYAAGELTKIQAQQAMQQMLNHGIHISVQWQTWLLNELEK